MFARLTRLDWPRMRRGSLGKAAAFFVPWLVAAAVLALVLALGSSIAAADVRSCNEGGI